jgi:hypothetical protein
MGRHAEESQNVRKQIVRRIVIHDAEPESNVYYVVLLVIFFWKRFEAVQDREVRIRWPPAFRWKLFIRDIKSMNNSRCRKFSSNLRGPDSSVHQLVFTVHGMCAGDADE